MAEKLVLGYSCGLDTSVIIRWIKEKYGYGVVTVAAKATTRTRKTK